MTSIDQSARAFVGETLTRLLTDPARLKTIARCWMFAAPIIYLVDLLRQTQDGLSDGIRRPLGDDFVNYWSGAFLALQGRAQQVYDFGAFHTFEQSVTSPVIDFYHYSYPPVLLLLTLPLALISYVPALGVWLVATWYGFYRALKMISGEGALVLSLASPALFVNAVGGQNGALTAALFCGGLIWLDRRPIIAGVLFGCLVYKPHLALMLPFALIAGRRWLAVVTTGTTAVLLVGASAALFGLQCWLDYVHNLGVLRAAILEDGAGVWHRMVSVFVFARRLGADVQTAYFMQAVAAALAAIIVMRSWWRDDSAAIRNALVIMGTCLMTPYLQDYDLVMGAFVVVWLKQELQAGGTGEQAQSVPQAIVVAAMAAMLLVPFFAAPIAKATGFVVATPFLVAVFAVLVGLAASAASKRSQPLLPRG
jgi:Glycosyltransferase family 87